MSDKFTSFKEVTLKVKHGNVSTCISGELGKHCAQFACDSRLVSHFHLKISFYTENKQLISKLGTNSYDILHCWNLIQRCFSRGNLPEQNVPSLSQLTVARASTRYVALFLQLIYNWQPSSVYSNEEYKLTKHYYKELKRTFIIYL